MKQGTIAGLCFVAALVIILVSLFGGGLTTISN